MQQVDAVASTEATVLITGESGTGKELFTKEVHRRSRRSKRPFVKVNCSAIPREIFESEFFGHARGAFTGAIGEPGRFQSAECDQGARALRRSRLRSRRRGGLLDINPTTLASRLRALKITPPKPR